MERRGGEGRGGGVSKLFNSEGRFVIHTTLCVLYLRYVSESEICKFYPRLRNGLKF